MLFIFLYSVRKRATVRPSAAGTGSFRDCGRVPRRPRGRGRLGCAARARSAPEWLWPDPSPAARPGTKLGEVLMQHDATSELQVTRELQEEVNECVADKVGFEVVVMVIAPSASR